MAVISSVATAVPPNVMSREAIKASAREVFGLDPRRLAAVLSIFDNAQVEQRYSALPLEDLVRRRSLEQTAAEYREHAIGLGRRVAADCLREAGMQPEEVDLLITVSCTGLMIPSLDAYLINELGFRSDVRRLPITALGCAAGAAALSRASEFVRACPGATVLVVAVELPSLTFQPGDVSMANLVSCALFGDGAAAALVTDREARGAHILDTQSHLFPDSLDAMGFELKDSGLHIVLSRDVPELVRSGIREVVGCLLQRNHLVQQQLSFLVLHPGGKKILRYLEEDLQLDRAMTEPAWTVLRNYGNLSSAAILFVLREWQTSQPPHAGAYGLLAAFGPGFSAELVLVQWS